jgi:orotidine-5'-phosphate decarboxylase
MTKLICAIDTIDVVKAVALAKAVKPHVDMVKLGLEFFYAHGVEGYRAIAKAGVPIFLDLKLHDIPNTVAGGISALLPLKPAMLTVHASGGLEMLKAARLESKKSKSIVLGVTILTSLDQQAIGEIGFSQKLESHVLRLAELVYKAGLKGVVCSPHELAAIKTRFKNDLITVVPGIRHAGSDKGDQSRTMTPLQARIDGADYIVVGRPITQAKDPDKAEKLISLELQNISL